jgi:hypothetical protein
MTGTTMTARDTTLLHTTCDPASRVTKTLLAYGVIAGPFYVAVSLTQALTRDGFDLARHPWSLLSNGDFGWIQVANFVVTGLLVLALAVGLRRALRPGRGARWAPRLIAVYGVSLIGAGVFRADPALGFPVGTPADQTEVSWHGLLHLVSGGIGFPYLIAACLVVARRFAAEGRRGWATCSAATGVFFLGAFVGIASGTASSAVNLTFMAAVLVMWTWISATAAHLYRRTAQHGSSL